MKLKLSGQYRSKNNKNLIETSLILFKTRFWEICNLTIQDTKKMIQDHLITFIFWKLFL